jgi:hypothetical protein
MNTKICLFISTLLSLNFAFAQQLDDSLQVNVGTIGTLAKDDYQPLWLVSNRFGAIADRQSDASTYAGFSNTHVIGKKHGTALNPEDTKKAPFYIKYGLNLINNNHFNNVFLQEGYIKAGYKKFEIWGGRFKDILGEVDKNLSSGSLGVSGNALPIPKIGFGFTDYVNMPFTNGWMQIRAQLSHGWFDNDRYMKYAYYHEKDLYLRFGKKKFKFFVGLQHYAEWGGRRDSIRLDRSLKGFWDVFASRPVNDNPGLSPGAVDSGLIYGEYHAGDQRAVSEFGFDLDTKDVFLHFYHQTPYEGNTLSEDLKNIDQLSGLSFTFKKETAFVKKLLLEFISTKQMGNYIPASQRQSYYNNGGYQTGWEYQDRIIGTPLFINRYRAQFYQYFQKLGIKPFDWNSNNTVGNANIIFNQIVGGTVGLSLRFSDKLNGRTIICYTSGKYQNLEPSLKQFYTLEELHYNISKNLNISAGLGFDTGDFTNNIGGLVGVHWQFKKY